MNTNGSALLRFAAALLFVAAPCLTQAQVTRSWVSALGDDVNPCSRTSPCRTFAGAMSNTAAGGEISVLDPGGYGAVTINKSMTIDGGHGSGWASILHTATNGIIINGAGIEVTLRNISLQGAGIPLGLNGIRIIAASKVWIENVQITGNSNRGISDERILPGQLNVINTIVHNNGQTGITVIPASGTTGPDAYLTNVQLLNNGNSGVAVSNGGRLTMVRSNVNGNASHGVYIDGSSSFLFLSESTLSGNTHGLTLGGGMPIVILSNNVITNNDNGVTNLSGHPMYTFGNNRILGNFAASTGFPLTPATSQ